MPLLTKRNFLMSAGASFGAVAATGGYAFAIEPGFRLETTAYALTPPGWPASLPLRIAVLADIHAGEPWMSASRIADCVSAAMAIKPDLIVLLGDYVCTHPFITRAVRPEAWADALSGLRAPLGVFAILGNHDWWSAAMPGMPPDQSRSVRRALARARIPVLENDAVRIDHSGHHFWLLGLGDQMAHRAGARRGRYRGVDDLDGALAQVRDDAPAILLAHEPFIFSRAPARIALTLAGHTHGGQVNFPWIGEDYAAGLVGSRHVYGHIVEDDRHMIISGGLGTSTLPVRFLRPPEVLDVRLGGLSTPLLVSSRI